VQDISLREMVFQLEKRVATLEAKDLETAKVAAKKLKA
jgi:hypothetical protein